MGIAEDLERAIKQYGIRSLLEELINNLEPYEEKYLKILQGDIETALQNYNLRYNSDITSYLKDSNDVN